MLASLLAAKYIQLIHQQRLRAIAGPESSAGGLGSAEGGHHRGRCVASVVRAFLANKRSDQQLCEVIKMNQSDNSVRINSPDSIGPPKNRSKCPLGIDAP